MAKSWPWGSQIAINFFFTFSPKEESFDYNVIVLKFKNFCITRQNTAFLKHEFLTYKQKEGQSLDEFMTQLKIYPVTVNLGNKKISN